MTGPVRVLLVDDSVVVRRIVKRALEVEPRIDVVGTAPHGALGLQKVEALQPDVVILDVEMPVLDGLATLRQIRRRRPAPKVIMFSTLTERGAAVTLEALTLGAADYAAKPSKVANFQEGQERVRAQLVPKILALCPRAGVKRPVARALPTPPATPVRARVEVVLVGCSTGGPNALAEIVPRLPAPLPVPILIVQHMPPVFTRLLAERLDKLSPFSVSEARGGESLDRNHAYVAPGGAHLSVGAGIAGSKRTLRVHTGPPENSCRPSVDVLFRSAAEVYGAGSLGVILTGMGKDGLVGCRHLKSAGGQVVAQDQRTSVVYGMPSWVAHEGLADRVLPVSLIAAEIRDRLRFERRLLPAGRSPVAS